VRAASEARSFFLVFAFFDENDKVYVSSRDHFFTEVIGVQLPHFLNRFVDHWLQKIKEEMIFSSVLDHFVNHWYLLICFKISFLWHRNTIIIGRIVNSGRILIIINFEMKSK
jgi:hypothetical protein